MKQMRTLELSGSPYQMGKQHGSAFAAEIRDFAASRLELLQGRLPDWSLDEIFDLAREQIDVLQEHREEFEEFCGIADGADIEQERLAILNNYTDMRNFTKENDEGCSVFCYNKNNEIVYGQTWDMSADAAPFVIHLKIDGPTQYQIFTVVGCMALCGVSNRGMGVFINDLKTSETGRGLMWPVLVRKLLKQRGAQEGAAFISKHLPASGHHYLICDKSEAYSIETTGKRLETIKVLKAGEGGLFHTNNYLGALKSTELPPVAGVKLTSRDRFEKMNQFFNQDKTLSYEEISKGLFGTPIISGGVCMYEGGSITCGGMVYDAQREKGEVFKTDYCTENATPFSF